MHENMRYEEAKQRLENEKFKALNRKRRREIMKSNGMFKKKRGRR